MMLGWNRQLVEGEHRGWRRVGRSLLPMLVLVALAACSSPRTVTPPPSLPQPSPVTQAPVEPPPPMATAPTTKIASPQDGRVRVALLVPLTGRGAAVGQAMLEAAHLALFDIADERFLLLPRDTAGTPEGAAAAAQSALADGAQLFLGPLFSSDAAAVRPIAAAARVPVLSFTNDWTVASPGLWPLGFQPQDQVNRVVSFAISQGITNFGLVAPSGSYGDAVVAAMQAVTGKAGVTLQRVERYRVGSTNLADMVRSFAEFDRRRVALERERARLTAAGDEASRQALARLANQQTFGDPPYGAVMLAEGGQTLRELAAMLPFFDVDPGPVRILGTGLWDEAGLGREPALVGGWLAAPARETRVSFEARYQQVQGAAPPRLASLAYDATALAAALARNNSANPFDLDRLTDANGFAGIDGIFRLLPNGQTERGLAIMEVTRTGTVIADPAPQTFVRPSS